MNSPRFGIINQSKSPGKPDIQGRKKKGERSSQQDGQKCVTHYRAVHSVPPYFEVRIVLPGILRQIPFAYEVKRR